MFDFRVVVFFKEFADMSKTLFLLRRPGGLSLA